MNKKSLIISIFLSLMGCSNSQHFDAVVSMQMIDRNGFSETLSGKERLVPYQHVNFFASQPYQKVLRVYGKNKEGKSHSKLTSYHSNGGIWQYLEASDGRANGRYFEWHENGKIKIEATIIEGLADLGEKAQKSWLFDQECRVFDEDGHLEAYFTYDKGYLVGDAKYYFTNGKLLKTIPYHQGKLHGCMRVFNEEGSVLEEVRFKKGQKDGAAIGNWLSGVSKYQEQYRDGLLINAIYFDISGQSIAEIENGQGVKAELDIDQKLILAEYHNGIEEGLIRFYDTEGKLEKSFFLKNGMKTGEERGYFPRSDKVKYQMSWFEDQIQGMVKTWYENGIIESQREFSANKKHGLSLAYFASSDLMLMEEYENDCLIKGSYYKPMDSTPVSTVENGEGVATLYNNKGHFLKKIPYEKGKPVL